MKIIAPNFEILDSLNCSEMTKRIESIGRICYKSENRITVNSSSVFVSNLIKSGHESVIEHEKISVKVICDRGVSHEIVRHRIASYSQESTRYCNYFEDKFGNELTLIRPFYWDSNTEEYDIWLNVMATIETAYNKLISMGAKPEEARSILPNSLKTEMVMTMNLREWRHFFKLRTASRAHPQMREITVPLLAEMTSLLPAIFGDIVPK